MIKMKRLIPCMIAVSLLSGAANAQGLLNKIKQKAAEAAEKAVDQKADELIKGKKKNGSTGADASNSSGAVEGGQGASYGNTGSGASSNKPRNTGGAGLVTTPPDVRGNLNSAETAFKTSNYSDARQSLQQAILGVEMEIGQQLLKSMPESVNGLPKQSEKDHVVSSGWGFTGLTIHREYMKEDKQLSMTIANNAIMMNAINMFFSNGAFAQSTTDQNWKQTKLKGNKAIIQFDQSSGYKLSVPLGQSTLIVFEGINFSNEQEVIKAAEQFDVESIKKTLGEK